MNSTIIIGLLINHPEEIAQRITKLLIQKNYH